jgi:hypothetical protein
MSEIGFGVKKYVYFGPKIGLGAPLKSFLCNTVNTKKLPYWHTIVVVHKVLDFGPKILGSKSAFLAPKMHILADFWQFGHKLRSLLTRGHSTVAPHITHFQKSLDGTIA